jgi:hypothetical protein
MPCFHHTPHLCQQFCNPIFGPFREILLFPVQRNENITTRMTCALRSSCISRNKMLCGEKSTRSLTKFPRYSRRFHQSVGIHFARESPFSAMQTRWAKLSDAWMGYAPPACCCGISEWRHTDLILIQRLVVVYGLRAYEGLDLRWGLLACHSLLVNTGQPMRNMAEIHHPMHIEHVKRHLLVCIIIARLVCQGDWRLAAILYIGVDFRSSCTRHPYG